MLGFGAPRECGGPGSLPAETVSYKSLFREVSMGPNGTLRYADLSAVAWWLLLGRFAHGGSSSQEVIDRDADGAEPVLGQDSTLAASDGAWAPPVPKVPYVSRWTSTHAPGEAAAAKWQSFAQKRQFTEVHMPDSCFVPMEGQPSGNVRRSADYMLRSAPKG